MSEWKEYRLGDIVTILGGFAYKGEHIGHGEGLLLGMGCVSFKEKFLMSGARPYAGDCAERYYANPGDLVLATRQQSDNLPILGMPAIIPQELDGKKLIVGANLYRVSNNSDFSNKYLYWLLKSNAYVNHIASCKTGTTVSMITKSNVEDFVFKAPEKQERARIVSVLSSLDDKIDLLHRENATLEALAETLFRHYFIENPNPTWKEGKLGDVCHYVTDKMETSSLTTISYISTENMLNDKQGVTEASSIPNDIRVTRYGVGDILLSNIRPYFKKIWLADRRGGCSNDVLCIRANEKEFDCFVYYTLRQDDFFDYVMLGSKGCKMPRGDKQHIMNWPICLPNVESLGVFNKPVYLMIQKIKSNQQQIQTLTTKRDTLLPRLMSGEVNVVAH